MTPPKGTLALLANVCVIVAVAFYFWDTAGSPAQERELRDRSSSVNLSETEWSELTQGGELLGDSNADVSLVEFVDYQCSYCSDVNRTIESYMRAHPSVGILVRQFPLSRHAAAEGAARAALCAGEQGRFVRMHSALFESSAWHIDRDWGHLAVVAGVPDIGEFERCLISEGTRSRIETDLALGAEFGVRGTPTFISRRSIYSGSLNRSTLSSLASGRSVQ